MVTDRERLGELALVQLGVEAAASQQLLMVALLDDIAVIAKAAAATLDDVGVAHPDAAGRHVGADGPGLVGAVDAIERRAEIHRTRAERVAEAHADHRLLDAVHARGDAGGGRRAETRDECASASEQRAGEVNH